MRLVILGLIGMSYVAAQQAAPQPRIVYEDARVRISEVRSGLRKCDTDCVWIAGTDVHFSRAGDTHAARTPEVVVQLLQRQTGPRNVCSEVLPGEYLHCHEPGSQWIGANLQILFETDQMHFGILQIAPSAKLAVPPSDVPPLLIALEGTEAEAVSHTNSAPANNQARPVTAANVLRSSADQVTEIRNTGKVPARFLVVEFGGGGE